MTRGQKRTAAIAISVFLDWGVLALCTSPASEISTIIYVVFTWASAFATGIVVAHLGYDREEVGNEPEAK